MDLTCDYSFDGYCSNPFEPPPSNVATNLTEMAWKRYDEQMGKLSAALQTLDTDTVLMRSSGAPDETIHTFDAMLDQASDVWDDLQTLESASYAPLRDTQGVFEVPKRLRGAHQALDSLNTLITEYPWTNSVHHAMALKTGGDFQVATATALVSGAEAARYSWGLHRKRTPNDKATDGDVVGLWQLWSEVEGRPRRGLASGVTNEQSIGKPSLAQAWLETTDEDRQATLSGGEGQTLREVLPTLDDLVKQEAKVFLPFSIWGHPDEAMLSSLFEGGTARDQRRPAASSLVSHSGAR